MKSQFSRRDFLKLGGLALGGAAISPIAPPPSDFDDSALLRIATAELPVRREPTDDSPIVRMVYRDELIHYYSLEREKAPVVNKHNPYWYRVWGGFLHRGRLHRVKYIFQKPAAIPEGTRRLAEVTVPFTTPWRNSIKYGWQSLAPPLYYGSVHWVEELIDVGPDGSPYWYRIYDELDSNVPYFVPALHLGIVPLEMFDPISPEIPLEQKKIEVNLTTQRLTCYEGDAVVFQTDIASGIPGGGQSGEKGLSTTTPNGKHKILDKYASKHMGNSYFTPDAKGNLLADADGYVLPGVPWTCFFTEVGHAFHGAYWHENFGAPMSHGCVNMRSSDANWLFRWALPAHTNDTISNHTTDGTQVEIHY